MVRQERVILKKVDIGNAAIFGIYFGIIIGVIVAFLFFLFTLFSLSVVADYLASLPGGEGFADQVESGSLSGAFAVAIIFFVFTVILVPVFVALCALVYNNISKIGGALHLNFEEYVEVVPHSEVKII